jgi:hypothetical protein
VIVNPKSGEILLGDLPQALSCCTVAPWHQTEKNGFVGRHELSKSALELDNVYN